MQTLGGHVTWTSSDKALNPVPNVCTTPVVGGQWVKGTKYPYDVKVVSNTLYPDIPTQGTLQPVKY
jgi:branched-chain amino acid transport system substrate-binding protein